MKFWQWILLTGIIVVVALLVQREWYIPGDYTDPYKEKYERILDSLEALQKEYDTKLEKASISIDSLLLVIDSLENKHNQISEEYEDLINNLESASEEDVVKEFHDYTNDIYEDEEVNVIISLHNVRGAVKLFYEGEMHLSENNLLTRQIHNYKDLVWNYQASIEIHKEKEKTYKEAISESLIYQGNLRSILEDQNKDIQRLQRRNIRNITIGGVLLVGVALIAL